MRILNTDLVTLFTQLSGITLLAQSPQDYEIVALRRHEIEALVLNNIQVLFRDLTFPIFYQGAHYIIFAVEQELGT
jgi:hypothetical protein